MIITCINCNKKFDINADLIPKNGRLLECSSCNHQWFFKIEKNEKVSKSSFKETKQEINSSNEIINIPKNEIKPKTESKKLNKNIKQIINKTENKQNKDTLYLMHRASYGALRRHGAIPKEGKAFETSQTLWQECGGRYSHQNEPMGAMRRARGELLGRKHGN